MSTSFPPPPPEDPINPYAAPATEIGSEPTGLDVGGDLAEAEAIRRAHIGHEASVRSLGALHYFGAIMGVIAVGAMLFLLLRAEDGPADPTRWAFVGGGIVFYILVTALNFALGNGLRGLKPWARWTETILLSMQLLFVLISSILSRASGVAPLLFVMLINGYLLYLMVSGKGSVVFSPAYKEIIARTPHIKYKTSIIVKIALAILVAVIAMGIIAAIVGQSTR